MIFSSVVFLFRFLPAFLILYYLGGERMRNVVLFLGSLFFYAWGEPVYVLLLLFSTGADYCHGRLIERFRGRRAAKYLLFSSLLINVALLGFFKYVDLLTGTVNFLAGTSLPQLQLPLPVGISFYTFQTMSYTIDVYRGKAEAQSNLLDFGVYVAMFPQLIAGPIVTYREVGHRLRKRSVDIYGISAGMRRFCIGLAKKVLIANQIGALWDSVSLMNFREVSALTAWLGILAFALQIYFDFSGYSDMAIGLGNMLGFAFPENFNYPYVSASVTEFWRRWHITLGSWFREYVYIPLGGNRRGLVRQICNILIVWMLTGIWHGAGWNFLFWGLWFALALILEKLFLGKLIAFLPKGIGILYTDLVVLVGWVLFAFDTPARIFGFLRAMFGIGVSFADRQGLYLAGQYALLFLLAVFCATPAIRRFSDRLKKYHTGIGIALCSFGERIVPAALLLLSIAGIVDASYNPFLYFRF